MKVILTNAPPSGGKDTLAQHVVPRTHLFPDHDIHFERFSRPHKEAFAAMTGSKIDTFYNVEYYEDHKNDVIPWLGVSYRQWQIDFSEKYMKPLYGDDIFTRMFYARARQQEAANQQRENAKPDLFILADCGFNVELKALLNYGLPAQDVLLLRVHRPGCTYKGDSRSYIYNKDVLACDIQNDSSKDVYYDRCLGVIKTWLAGGSDMLKDLYNQRED